MAITLPRVSRDSTVVQANMAEVDNGRGCRCLPLLAVLFLLTVIMLSAMALALSKSSGIKRNTKGGAKNFSMDSNVACYVRKSRRTISSCAKCLDHVVFSYETEYNREMRTSLNKEMWDARFVLGKYTRLMFALFIQTANAEPYVMSSHLIDRGDGTRELRSGRYTISVQGWTEFDTFTSILDKVWATQGAADQVQARTTKIIGTVSYLVTAYLSLGSGSVCIGFGNLSSGCSDINLTVALNGPHLLRISATTQPPVGISAEQSVYC